MLFFTVTIPASATLDTWLSNLAAGKREALEPLYQQTKTQIYAFAFSILKHRQDAEDVLQDTYVRLYRSAASYRPEGKPLAWILTITKHLCYQRLREQRREPGEPTEELTSLPTTATVEDKLLLEGCLLRLSDEERQVITLHAVAGFKHREIAHMLGLSLPAVLSRYNRAIHKLRQLCEEGELHEEA